MKRIDSLEGLRGIAALMVLFSHLGVMFYPAYYWGAEEIGGHCEFIEYYLGQTPLSFLFAGYNLFIRVREYKENELLFLHDMRVPANNSLCERLTRVYKWKQKRAVTLRSCENLCYICDCLGVVCLLRAGGENVYQKISEIYGRKRPPRVKEEAGAKA